jgi:hypothetical protein
MAAIDPARCGLPPAARGRCHAPAASAMNRVAIVGPVEHLHHGAATVAETEQRSGQWIARHLHPRHAAEPIRQLAHVGSAAIRDTGRCSWPLSARARRRMVHTGSDALKRRRIKVRLYLHVPAVSTYQRHARAAGRLLCRTQFDESGGSSGAAAVAPCCCQRQN